VTSDFLERLGRIFRGNRIGLSTSHFGIDRNGDVVMEHPTEDEIDNVDIHYMALGLNLKSRRVKAYQQKCLEWQGKDFTLDQVHENTGFLLLERALHSQSRVARQAVKALYLHFADFNEFEYFEAEVEQEKYDWY
jgi:hypothetical protein